MIFLYKYKLLIWGVKYNSVIWNSVTYINTVMKLDEVELVEPPLATWNVWEAFEGVSVGLDDCDSI